MKLPWYRVHTVVLNDPRRFVIKCTTCFQSLHLVHCSTATCTSTASSTNDSYANYFVDSLGFTQQNALSISTKLFRRRNYKVIDSKFIANADSLVALFKRHGFDEPHIRTIVSKQPRFLTTKVGITLQPKIRALQEDDFSQSDIIRLISNRPIILLYGLEDTILPVIQILRQVMGSVSNVIKAMERLRETHFRNVGKWLLPNVALLNSYGVSIELIRKHIIYQPGYFVRNPEVFKDYVMRNGEKLGITRHSQTTDAYVKYLVDSLGFTHQQAVSISTKQSHRRSKVYDSTFIDNANSVVTLLINLGFNDTHIRNIVFKQPCLLASKVNKTLRPKIRALQDEDFSASDIIHVISRRPEMLLYRLESTILPAIHILKQVMGSIANVVNAIERFKEWHFRPMVTCLLPNVALLSIYGVPIELTRKQILYKPHCYVRNPEVFKGILMIVERKLGLTRDSPMFLYGINLISGMTGKTVDGVESKCQIFKSFGWTQSDVETFIMKNAIFFTFSGETIKKKLDFLINDLELEPAYLISRAGFMICSLEKRIIPRHKILLILKEKGLLEKNPSLYHAIKMPEPRFLKMFVLPFKEVHETYAKLTGCSVEILT